jgi:formate hydrogenlyase transcriptional activator
MAGQTAELELAECSAELRRVHEQLKEEINSRTQTQTTLSKINDCFLGFRTDPIANINRLTELCGDLLRASSAFYNRLAGGLLHAWGMWNVPPDYNPVDKPDGHICYELIQKKVEKVYVISNLQESDYAQTAPIVNRYKYNTYVGRPVRLGDTYVGNLCVFYSENYRPSELDKDLMGIIAKAIAVEERRRDVEESLRRALSEVKQLKDRLQAENVYLQEEIKLEHNFEEIIGSSEALKRSLVRVEQVASTDATVIILGETGTGKELFARAVHDLSHRKERPLVKVNCASLPPTLIESELFGHEKGAFTGALSRKIGRFELADNGTIFLDEVGDLPLDLQAKLLRVLQEGELERVGGSRTIKVDVRVIGATHKNLEKSVKAGQFRQDLYFRLNVFPIALPSLRERVEDIPLLSAHFIKKYGKRLGKRIETVSQRAMDALKGYHWPGNVRELENIIERAMILTPGSTLQLDDSLEMLTVEQTSADNPATLHEVQRNHIQRILNETEWKIEGKFGAAARLGLKPSTLRSRMQKLGIRRPHITYQASE